MAGASAPGLVVELSELRKPSGILTKKIALGEDGKPKSDGSACRLVIGKASRKRMNGSDPAGALAGYLNEMNSRTALALGRITAPVADECRVVAKKQLPDYDDAIPTITRTLDNFAFSDGPGWALLDFDTGGMPQSAAAMLASMGGFDGVLRSLLTGFDDAAQVTRANTSSGIVHTETGEQFPGSGGRHTYVLLAEQRDVPRFLSTLHKRAWLAGFGWLLVGAIGQLLERSIIDVSVGSPEKPGRTVPPEAKPSRKFPEPLITAERLAELMAILDLRFVADR